MCIHRDTLNEWKKKFSDISDALKKGKEVVDREVENSLYKNAVCYEYTEEVVAYKKEVTYKDGKRLKEVSEPVAFPLKRYKHGETAAQIFWLINRKPPEWRQKREGLETDMVATENNFKEELTAINKAAEEVWQDAESEDP